MIKTLAQLTDLMVAHGQLQTGAHFSDDKTYRYMLWRIMKQRVPPVAIIGLNPSTANEDSNDHTITRLVSMVPRWGYGGFYMLNLFALVSPYPNDLMRHPDPLGDNQAVLESFAHLAAIGDIDIVFAWGRFMQAQERAKIVQAMFPQAKCLRKNQDGSPMHPLFCPGSTKLIPF